MKALDLDVGKKFKGKILMNQYTFELSCYFLLRVEPVLEKENRKHIYKLHVNTKKSVERRVIDERFSDRWSRNGKYYSDQTITSQKIIFLLSAPRC